MEKDNPSQDLIVIEREDDEVGEDLLPAEQRQRLVMSDLDEVPVGEEVIEVGSGVRKGYEEFDPEADHGGDYGRQRLGSVVQSHADLEAG